MINETNTSQTTAEDNIPNTAEALAGSRGESASSTSSFEHHSVRVGNTDTTQPLSGYISPAVIETIKANPPTENSFGYLFDGAKQVTDERLRTISPALMSAISESNGVNAFASNTVQGPASIVELARALNVDGNGPQLMYEWVYNNIEWESGWGLQKGALGTLMDGMGNSFDQSMLLATLLRQAGFTANLVLGKIRLTQAQYQAWWGVNDIFGAQSYAGNTFVPIVTVPTFDGVNWYMDISHVWVQWVNGPNTCYFDPSIKAYNRIAQRGDIATILGYTPATFMADALSGATVTTDYAQNINKTNIRNDLQTYTSNLVTWIKSNKPDAQVDDIFGGQSIIPATIPLLQTSLPYEAPGDVPTIWTGDVPVAYKATLQFQYPNFNTFGVWDITWSTTSDQLAGKRLTLIHDGTLTPKLYLDGTLVATGLPQSAGTFRSVFFTVTQPAHAAANYPVSWQQFYQTNFQWWQTSVYTDGYYLIGNAWGNQGRGQMDWHANLYAANKAAGLSDVSEPVIGEHLAMTFSRWSAQNSRMTDLVNRLKKCRTVYNHQVGLVAYNSAASDLISIDLGSISASSSNLNNDTTQTPINDTVIAMHGVAIESATMAQMNGVTPGVSTTSVIDVSHSAGNRIYKGTPSNWSVGSNIQAALLANGYSAADMNAIASGPIAWGWSVLLPDRPNQVLGVWTVRSHWEFPVPNGALGITNGNFKFGGGQPPGKPPKPPVKPPEKGKEEKDPVDTVSGAFTFNKVDLTIGSQSAPHGLTFSRSYSSNSQYVDGVLGRGWSHNHQSSVAVSSDGLLAMCEKFAEAGACSIAELFVVADVISDTARPVEKLVAITLADNWWLDQMVNNTVTITLPDTTATYVKQPDGSYTHPADVTSTLTLAAGLYKVTSPQGVVANFDANGKISSVVYPYGVTITYTYTSGLLTSITNGLGRTLTLAYTGQRLSSVSDGTGRSVVFTVDGNANLTAVVDPNLKTYSYVYDQPGRMTQIFQPNSAVVAYNTNVYDSLSRVKSQKNALNQESFFYLAGSRAEVIDPLGHSVIYYYNRFSRVLRAINALGFETKYEYDGLQRLTKATMPELNEVRYTYDSFNNVMSQTLVPKPGSLLANLSTSFTYDPVWKKVKTSVDAKGQTTTFNYDPSTGNLLSIVRPNVGGFSPTTSMTWNARGQVLTATDPSGVLTQFSYDLATEKLLSIVVDPGISPHLALTTSYGYDTVGNVTSVTNPNLNQSTFLYDSLRRRTQITSPAPFNFVTKYVFDDNSNLLNIQRQTGGLPMFQQTDYTYSATNQLLTVTDSSGNSLTHTYDGKDRLATVSDAQSRVVQFGYDALDRRYQVTDPNLVVSSVLTFSNNGLLATSADARSNVTQYLYDGFGRIDKVIYPDTTFIQNQTYDANGNVLTHVTRAGNNVIVTYDALDRISTVTPQSQPQVSYIYDLAGRLTQASKPTVAGDPSSGALQYFFDTAGRFFKEQYPDGKTVTHLLDANGNWIKTTWPDGYFIERVFDQLDRLTDIKLNGAVTAAAHFDYNQLSQRIATTFGNGTSVSYDREIDGTLPSLTHNFVGSSVTFSYGYNSDYELTGQQMTDLSYLWRPTPAGTISYGTASANDTYPTVGGVAQSYNGNKCLTGDGVWTYVYDTENHLISASKVGVTASFVYDPSNRQSQKTVGSVKSRYVYSGWQRIADYDGTTDSLQTRYIYGSGLDEPLIQVSSTGVPTYLHHDRMGTVIGVSNAAGMIVNKSKIGPFGEVGAMAGTNFGLTGQRYDSELGLYYYKNRYYSPTLGRFLQPDPIGTAGGANLYAYVGNAPFNFTDPLGLDPRDPNDEDYDGYNINDYNGGDATVGEKIELEDDGSESSPGDTQRSGGGGGGGGAPWLFPPAEAYPGGHPNNLDPATRHPKSTYGDRYTSVEHTGKAAGKRTIIVNPKAFADPSTTGAIGLGKDYVGKTQQRTPKGNINPLGRSPDHFTEGRNTGNKEVIIPTKEPNVKKVEQGFINKYRARPSVDKFGRPMPKLTNTRNPWPNASSAAAGFAYMWLEYVLNAQTDHPAY